MPSLACRDIPSRNVVSDDAMAGTSVSAAIWPSWMALARRCENIFVVSMRMERIESIISVSSGEMLTAASTSMQPQGVSGESKILADSSKYCPIALYMSGSAIKRLAGPDQYCCS